MINRISSFNFNNFHAISVYEFFDTEENKWSVKEGDNGIVIKYLQGEYMNSNYLNIELCDTSIEQVATSNCFFIESYNKNEIDYIIDVFKSENIEEVKELFMYYFNTNLIS
jgi:hypothetical protein